ncbi:DUF3810 domain-containing protein [Flavobacterium coralii]|uniref:DUF3810 domain-containing protein n=1 Tax=Flavobacterium coralii TaxID=2838017 RepID=UPI000C57FD63|nr:amino acid permease [Flavobacterium sp.]|tara:strand:- start:11276 stop:12337 length:1062 start_codon:yes stop_codon:yes gene_type:complete
MKKKIILCLLLPLQIIIVNLLSLFPDFVENYYSTGLYLYIAKASRIIFGVAGFSVGDIIYTIVIILIIRWLWIRRKTWRRGWKANLVTIGSFLSVFYFLFYFLWAVNYHRVPLNEKMGIEKKYTPEELISFTKRLITKANAVHLQITGNDSIKVVNPYAVEEIYSHSPDGYKGIALLNPNFTFKHESLKSSLLSTPLSYMGFGGYLNPFTNEAQVNCHLPLYNLPTTACHEMSHQLGYASESEANFIGYMASIANDDIYFKYSGYTFALKYCLRNIKKIDEAQAEALLPLINKGILQNYKETDQFSEKYESFVETIFKYFYDNYLKLNHQEDGLETYSKFVGLLVNYYKDKDL